jgi:hypothetical protein
MFRKIRERWMRRKPGDQPRREQSPPLDTPEKEADLIKKIQAAQANQPGRMQ